MTKAVVMLAGALAALPAMAIPITFTVSDTASGSFSMGPLNGQTFNNVTITFTETTDTSDISSSTCGFPCAPDVTTNTVTIAGFGTLILSGGSFFFDNSGNLFGITNALGSAFLAANSFSAFTSYTMTTAISGTAPEFVSSAVSDVPLSDGSNLTITNLGATVNYQACLQCGTAGTPEPGSLGLVLAGAIPLAAGLLRRRKRTLFGRQPGV